jgi:hypothetical protein
MGLDQPTAGVLWGILMTGKISASVGNSRLGLIGRRASGAVLLAWIAIFMAPAVNAAEPAREAGAKGDVADRLNHQQVAVAAVPTAHRSPFSAAAEELGKDENNPFKALDPAAGTPSTSLAKKDSSPTNRVWTDARGNKLTAKFVRVHDENVVLLRAGRTVTLPWISLNADDQAYVRELLTARGEAASIPKSVPARAAVTRGSNGLRRMARAKRSIAGSGSPR